MSVYLPYYIHSPQNQASTYSLSFLIIIVREGFADFIVTIYRFKFYFFGSNFFSSFQPWCSTEVDETGHHKGGRGKWGNCGAGCPIPPDDREATVVVPDTKGRSLSHIIS